MFKDVLKLGTGGLIGLFAGIALVLYVQPTTPGGITAIIVISTIAGALTQILVTTTGRFLRRDRS